MRRNTMKEKMQKGELVTGCMLQGYLPSLVEICGLAGFDFVFLDAEHGPLSPGDCEGLVRAAEVRGITPLVRVPDLQESTLLRYLDVGAMGVILPGVSSVQEAREAVAAVKYHPLGKRGLNGVRASGYGMERPLADYAQEANRETVVLAIIENTAAMEALPEILQVEGLDGLIFGAMDYSQAVGVPGQGQHPLVQEGYEKLLAAGRNFGKPVGTVVRAGETLERHVQQGARLLLTSAFGLFGREARRFVQTAQQEAAKGSENDGN